MGRMWVEFDPEGYSYTEEPGFHYSITGKDFASKIAPDPRFAGKFAHSFLTHPLLDWLLPVPRQWAPDFYRDSRLDQHVIPLALWAVASGVTTREFELTKKSDGTTFPKNKWVQVSRIPVGTVGLTAVNYANLGAVSGVTFPSGFCTVAVTATTPVGVNLTTPGHLFTPQFEWSSPPAPDNAMVFGFGDLAFVLVGDTVTLCRGTAPGGFVTWERIGGPWKGGRAPGGYINAWDQDTQPLTIAPNHQLAMQRLQVVLFGWNHLVVYLNGGEGVPVKLNDLKPGNDLPFRAGGWWVGMAPGQKSFWQAQVMGYEEVSTTFAVTAGKPLILFDLGETYNPTVDPERSIRGLLHTAQPSDQVISDIAGLVTVTSPYTGNTVAYNVSDPDGTTIWDSDGTRHAGGFALTLFPSTPLGFGGAYLAPQVSIFELRFPVKFAPRDASPVVLADTEWAGWTCETSYREPRGKRLSIDLKTTGAATFYAAGLHRRGCYPVHIVEDTNADNVPDTIRVRGWVTTPDITRLLVEDDDGDEVIRVTRVHAEGLLSRVDRLPAYLPQLVNPTGDGTMSHRYVASEVFQQSGFDPTTDTYIHISTALAGTSLDKMPDQWADRSDIVGKRYDNDYAQTWDETHLQYLERLATLVFGWVVYETLNEVYYHPDLPFELVNGGKYFRGGTIYRSHANATAAGVPGQCFLTDGEESVQEPRGNRVRVLSQDYEDRLTPWMLDSYPPAYEGAGGADENRTGEPITVTLMAKINADADTTRRSARVFLFQCYRRLFNPRGEVPLPPWRISGDDDATVGRVWAFEGFPDDNLIVHMEARQVTSRPLLGSFFTTRLVGEKTPQDAEAGAVSGNYPGKGQAA